MAISDLENIKIDIYMHIWESFNASDSLYEFEQLYLKRLFFEKSVDYKKKEILFLVIKDFYKAHNVEVSPLVKDDEIYFKKTVLDYENNLFLAFLYKASSNPKNDIVFQTTDENPQLKYMCSKDLEEILNLYDDYITSFKERVEILRRSVKSVFGFDEKDVVFYINQKIYVRLFDKSKLPSEKRFNGIPEDDILALFKENEKLNYRSFIDRITKKAFVSELNLSVIDNVSFHKKWIKYYQESLIEAFKSYIESSEVLVGFANYVLRNFFTNVIENFCNEIIRLVEKNDLHIKEFINFYDGGEYTENGRKIKKSGIYVSGKIWSYYPIYNLIIQRKTLEDRLLKQRKDKSRYIEELEENKIKIKVITEEIEKYELELEKIKMLCRQSNQNLRDLRLKFQSMQSDFNNLNDIETKRTLSKNIEDLRIMLKELALSDDELVRKREKIENKIDRFNIEIINRDNKILALNQILETDSLNSESKKDEYLKLVEQEKDLRNAIINAISSFRI